MQAIQKAARERGLIQESCQPRSDIWGVRKDHKSSPSIMQEGDSGPGRSRILPEETEWHQSQEPNLEILKSV